VIEVAQFSKWTYFFQAFGRNPLILYVCSGVVIALISFIPIGNSNLQDVIYAEAFASWLEPKNASFLFAIAYMLLIWSIGFLMDKNKIYIKV
jgi:predicted acyltransferase